VTVGAIALGEAVVPAGLGAIVIVDGALVAGAAVVFVGMIVAGGSDALLDDLLLLLLEDDFGGTPFLDLLLPDLDFPFLLFDVGANVVVGKLVGNEDGTCEGLRVLGFCDAGFAVGTLEPFDDFDDFDDHDHPFPPLPFPLLSPFPFPLLSPFPFPLLLPPPPFPLVSPFPFPLIPNRAHTSSRLWVFRCCWTCPRTRE
jgi:hypothetical protein